MQASDNHRVYQAAGNQYVHHYHPDPPSSTQVNALPRDITAFVGREREIRLLMDAIHRHPQSNTTPVYAIDGMPGVGKTALAVRVGHLMRDWFPDGQFFLDLHAHTSGRQPLSPDDALFDLLSAAGIQPEAIPRGTDARAALWRGRLAGKRTLIILDNVAGRWQVQPLLPGTRESLVLITSRRRLVGLMAHQAALPLPLGIFPEEDAVALFAAMAERSLDAVEAQAVQELVLLAGCLPLAICLLAARFRAEPQWKIGLFTRELVEAKDRLAHMYAEDIAIAATFDLSYQRLPAPQRRFLRRVGLHPGPELEKYAAAALDNSAPGRAQRYLEALYRDHLLDQPAYGRYRMHDLVKQFATIRAEQDPIKDRRLARDRLFDYYQQASHAAAAHLSQPDHQASTVVGASSTATPRALPALVTRPQAITWFRTELVNLLACVEECANGSEKRRLPAFSATLAGYLRLAGPWEKAILLHRAAVRAATPARLPDTLHELGVIHRLRGEYECAEQALSQALQIYEENDQAPAMASALTQLGAARRRTGAYRVAVESLDRALEIYERLGDLRGQAAALEELGVIRHRINDHRAALTTLKRALTIHDGLDNSSGKASSLTQIGTAQLLTCQYSLAVETHARALAIYRELGDRHGEACALNYLGVARSQIGEYEAARTALLQALTIHRDLGYRPGEANALNYLGLVHRGTGTLPAAERAFAEALAIYLELGYRPGEADALNQLGILSRVTGDHEIAAQRHEEALAIFRNTSDWLGQAEALNSIGDLLLARRDPAAALTRYRRARRLARKAHNPRAEAHALAGAGHSALHASAGTDAEAAGHLREAEAICRRIGIPDIASSMARLIADGNSSS